MKDIKTIIEKYNHDPSQLISMLHDIQAKYNYLPKDVLKFISDKLKIPLSDVYQVATFYKAFSLKPKGKHIIKVCLGTACHVRGAQRILESVERTIGVKSGETTKDNIFSLESVNCLGCCALGPVIVVDKEYHGKMSPDKVGNILRGVEIK